AGKGASPQGARPGPKNWFALYPASQHGVARLEFFECKDPAAPPERLGTRRLDKKIVRLADCLSVAPAAESGPRDGPAAFCLETSARSYLLAADKQQSEEWVAKLCEIAFPVSAGRGPGDAPGAGTLAAGAHRIGSGTPGAPAAVPAAGRVALARSRDSPACP
uniref:DOK1 protein n=1 Tax=Dromaius novaehollandiae TaxID=8790 RepID=A0A8C4KDG6_DRONO